MARTLCRRCGRLLEVGDYPFCSGQRSDHGPVRRRSAAGFKPVVVFRNAKGEFSFPGRAEDPAPKGYERVELKTMREIHSLERTVNSQQKHEWERGREAERAAYAEKQSTLRSELRQQMQRMTPMGRDFAQAAMRRNDERPTEKFDPGFLVQVAHYDQSSRPEWRSEDTGWRGRRE